LSPELIVRLLIELLTSPECGGFCRGIEVRGLIQHAIVVITHQRPRAVLAHQVDAFKGIRPIAHGVAQADDPLDATGFDVSEHHLEGGGVGVDVGDNGCGHGSSGTESGMLWPGTIGRNPLRGWWEVCGGSCAPQVHPFQCDRTCRRPPIWQVWVR
jgi:hypothetical protein